VLIVLCIDGSNKVTSDYVENIGSSPTRAASALARFGSLAFVRLKGNRRDEAKLECASFVEWLRKVAQGSVAPPTGIVNRYIITAQPCTPCASHAPSDAFCRRVRNVGILCLALLFGDSALVIAERRPHPGGSLSHLPLVAP
jgi:hypothetical protein